MKTELLGRPVVGQYVSHAPIPEHRLACEGADGRHSGMYAFDRLVSVGLFGLIDE
jgi:hypothetical protein